MTHGLTTTEFALTFSNLAQQWRQVRTTSAVPPWQFQGGDVFFDATITYLSNAEPVDNAMFLSWFQGTGFSNWLKDGLWTPEHNRRGSVRDAPHQYAALQRQIDDIRIQMTNRPSR